MEKLPLSLRWQLATVPSDRTPLRRKATSTRVPGCQRRTVMTRAPRVLTFSVNVISLGRGSFGQVSSAANICGIRLADRPSDRLVETEEGMTPGNSRDGQG